MKKFNKIFVNAILVLLMLVGVTAIGNTPKASAATRKGYSIGTSNTRVYSDTSLKTPKGWIYPTDEITVNAVYSKYSYVTYPIADNKSKSGYIPTSSILLSTGGTTYSNKGGNFATYRRPGGAKYGTSTKGDNVTILGVSGSYTQIKYNVSGGFKYAFALTSDINKYVKGTGNVNVSSATVANGTYTLVSALNNNYVADISGGSTASQANCQLYQSNGTNAQKFTVTYNSDGYYTIKNVGSGKVLDCAGAGRGNGTNIWQYDSNSTAAQRWKITNAGNGYYIITCKCNGKCMDVSGGKVYNGNNIQIYQSNGTNSQKWKLVATSLNSPSYSPTTSVAQQLVNYELSQVGIGDYKGNNNVKYNTWYYGKNVSGNGYAWCMAFQAYCCNQITGSNNAIPKTASCTSAVNIFKNRGQFHYSKCYGGNYTPKAGDIVFYTNGSKYSSCHVGMITSAPVNGYLQTVEGNIVCSDGHYKVVTFSKNSKRTVSSSYVLGYATPNY